MTAKHQRLWLTVAALLLLIWGAVALVMHLTVDHVSWPEKVTALMDNAPWQAAAPTSTARGAYLDEVIANVNRLDLQQTRRLREIGQPSIDRFFATLNEEEQKIYVNKTIERHFEAIERGIKLLSTDERKRMIARLRNDLKPLRANSQNESELLDQDREFYESALSEDPLFLLRTMPPKEKMQIAPAIESMLSRFQGTGMRR